MSIYAKKFLPTVFCTDGFIVPSFVFTIYYESLIKLTILWKNILCRAQISDEKLNNN